MRSTRGTHDACSADPRGSARRHRGAARPAVLDKDGASLDADRTRLDTDRTGLDADGAKLQQDWDNSGRDQEFVREAQEPLSEAQFNHADAATVTPAQMKVQHDQQTRSTWTTRRRPSTRTSTTRTRSTTRATRTSTAGDHQAKYDADQHLRQLHDPLGHDQQTVHEVGQTAFGDPVFAFTPVNDPATGGDINQGGDVGGQRAGTMDADGRIVDQHEVRAGGGDVNQGGDVFGADPGTTSTAESPMHNLGSTGGGDVNPVGDVFAGEGGRGGLNMWMVGSPTSTKAASAAPVVAGTSTRPATCSPVAAAAR